MTRPLDDRDPLDRLAEEFLDGYRRGDRPAVSEYAARHPDRAGEIRDLLSALLMLEGAKSDSATTIAPAGAPAGGEAPPERLGEYRLLREVGRGGMGIVYEAEQETLGRRVALKVLAKRPLVGADYVLRFHREARAAARLHHTNIVPVFGVGEHEGLHYYVMQFIRGAGLDAVLAEMRRLRGGGPAAGVESDDAGGADGAPTRVGRFDPSAAEIARSLLAEAAGRTAPPDAAGRSPSDSTLVLAPGSGGPSADSTRQYVRTIAAIGHQAAEALDYAHRQGVLHRDIKPSNLLLDAQGTVWVTDFGLAKATEDDDLTRSGDLVGTLRYMAPERFGGRCDARSDVYALGLTLYELLAGRPAFDASGREQLIRQVTQTDPPRLGDLRKRLPRDLETIVHKAIERDPDDRYATSGDLARDLDLFLADRPIAARRASAAERAARWARRNPGIATLGASVALLLTAIAVGSTVSSVLLARKHSEAVAATHEARERLWESYLAQARATRRGGEAGRRFAALGHVEAAARLGVHGDRLWELRDEAIACLALTDLRPVASDPDSLPPYGGAAAFDSDFQRFARVEPDGRVSIREVSDGREVVSLPGAPTRPVSVRFSPDGRRLAAKCEDGARVGLALWDVSGRQVILGAPEGVYAEAFDFSPDGRWLAAGRRNGSIDLYDAATGRLTRRLPAGVAPHWLAFDPAGRRLAVSGASAGAAVQVRDLEGGAVTASFRLPAPARGLAWNPDGRRIAAGGEDGRVYLVDVEAPDGKPGVLEGHQGPVASAAFHPGGDLLATASRDGTLRLWDVDAAASVVSASLPDAAPVRFSRDGRLLGPGRDGPARWLWEVAYGRACVSRTDWSGPVDATAAVEFAPELGLLIATGEGGVRIDALAQGGTLGSIPLPGTSSCVLLRNGPALVTSGETGLNLWPIGLAGEAMTIGPPRPFAVTAGLPTGRARLAPDGRTLAVVLDRDGGRGVIFDVERPAEQVEFAGHPGVDRLAFSGDSRWLATGARNGTGVHVYDARTGRREADLPVKGSADVCFSPDGRRLVTGSADEYRAWEVGTWRPAGGVDRINTGGEAGKMAFSPDGTLLALVRSRSVVQLVDPERFEVLTTLVAPELRNTASLSFSPGGGRLAVAHNARVVSLWNLRAARAELAALKLDLPTPPIPSSPPDAAAPASIAVVPQPWLDAVRTAESHAGTGRWGEAAAAYEAALEAGDRTPRDWSRLALLALAAGDADLYGRTCREMLDHYGGAVPGDVAGTIARALTAGSPEGVEGEQVLRLAVAAAAGRNDPAELDLVGAALYRAGRHDEALRMLERGLAAHASGGSPYGWAFLAMTCQRLGRSDEARGWLDRLDGRVGDDGAAGGGDWDDALELRLLRDEARSLLDASP